MIKAFLICGVFMQQNTKDEVVTRNCNHNRPLQKKLKLRSLKISQVNWILIKKSKVLDWMEETR